MLIKFSVQNYLSFKDLNTLDMLPASISQHKNYLLDDVNYKLLKSAAVFGANASGKSNLFHAMGFARGFILNSSRESQAGEKIAVTPFLLSTETENQPSLFEFVFIVNNVKYRYGFCLNNTEVVDEWLFEAKKIKETLLFKRHLQEFDISTKFKEGNKVKDLTRNNALLLSVAAQFNIKIAKDILSWFIRLNVISGLSEYNPVTIDYVSTPEHKKQFIDILKTADFSIEDFKLQERNMSEVPNFIQKAIAKKQKEIGGEFKLLPEIKTLHKKYGKNFKMAGYIEFDLEKKESKGTKNLFSLLGPILDTIETNGVLVIDELETNLHPLISRFLIKMFNIKNKSAQFIFNTHDTNLLSNKFFRRDQIYFVNKDKFGQSNLYSLYEYDNVPRADKTLNKDYLEGKYKAIPFIDNYGFFGTEECL